VKKLLIDCVPAMYFPQAVYNALPSRPVSAERQISQPAESILADRFLKPHNADEARLRRQSAWWEMIGYLFATSVLLVLSLSMLIMWLNTFVVPYGTFLRASCLVLNSTQSSVAEGFMREPLFRAEVYVYVFNTTYTDCCCPNYYGQDRCAEWEALAYDTIMQSFTSGDKTDFLADYGYPGTFHACWHSPLKDQVVLVRSFYGEFLMAPTLAFIFGVLGLRNSFLKIDTYRESANLFDKLTGKIDTSSSEPKTEDMSLNFCKKEADDEAEGD
jgi:hypothetical protein